MSNQNENIKKNLLTKSTHRGSVKTQSLKFTGNWIKKIKSDQKWKDDRITEEVSLTVSDKNWHCLECNKYYKATCSNDIVKHIAKSDVHDRN